MSGGLASLLLAVFAPAKTALQAGEELTYAVRWAVLPNAGQIKIAATEHEVDDASRLHVTMQTETRGLAKRFLSFEASSESIFDLPSGRLVSLHERSETRNKHTNYHVSFDHDARLAAFTDRGATAPLMLDVPEGDPADLITTLMKTRTWDLPIGESRDVLVSFRDEFYLLTIYATKLDRVSTALGEFETLVLEPRMEKMPPKGMFKRGASVKVWVSQDELRLPVRFQVSFKVGTGVATLTHYKPPSTPMENRFIADE